MPAFTQAYPRLSLVLPGTDSASPRTRSHESCSPRRHDTRRRDGKACQASASHPHDRVDEANANKEEIIMPLVKSPSKAAFRKNIKAEVNAGKPVKQAVAIAYSVKREAAKKGKK